MKNFIKVHAARWIGEAQLRQIFESLGLSLGTSGGIDASSITSGTISADHLYAAINTYAALPAPASLPNGAKVLATGFAYDALSPYALITDGSDAVELQVRNGKYIPVSGELVLALNEHPGVVGTATVSNGSSNNITFATALPRVYSDGFWYYGERAGNAAPNLNPSDQWNSVFCVMSSTTVGTIYNKPPSKGGVPINVTGGPIALSLTTAGRATSIQTPSPYLPAGLAQLFSSIQVEALVRFPANTDAKGFSVGVDGGVHLHTFNSASHSSARITATFKCNGVDVGSNKTLHSVAQYGTSSAQYVDTVGGTISNGMNFPCWMYAPANSWAMMDDLVIRARVN